MGAADRRGHSWFCAVSTDAGAPRHRRWRLHANRHDAHLLLLHARGGHRNGGHHAGRAGHRRAPPRLGIHGGQRHHLDGGALHGRDRRAARGRRSLGAAVLYQSRGSAGRRGRGARLRVACGLPPDTSCSMASISAGSACLRGAGDVRLPAVMVLALSWLLFVPLAHSLSFAAGAGWVDWLPQFGLGAVGGWFAALTYVCCLGLMLFFVGGPAPGGASRCRSREKDHAFESSRAGVDLERACLAHGRAAARRCAGAGDAGHRGAAACRPSAVSVAVLDLDSGRLVLSQNPDTPRSPASTIKVVTTFAALDLLGPAYTWHTRALIRGGIEAGVLDGDSDSAGRRRSLHDPGALVELRPGVARARAQERFTATSSSTTPRSPCRPRIPGNSTAGRIAPTTSCRTL